MTYSIVSRRGMIRKPSVTGAHSQTSPISPTISISFVDNLLQDAFEGRYGFTPKPCQVQATRYLAK